MYPLVHFDTIIIEPPHEKIFRRLGYRQGITNVPPERQAEIEASISEALSLIHLRGRALRAPLEERSDSRVVLSGSAGEAVFTSCHLTAFLDGCSEAILMGATAGGEITAAIAGDVAGGRMTRAVVFDATASEMVDAALDWIMTYCARELRRENKILTKNRFSAGYGDLLLDNQETIFRMLELEQIGVSINERFVLAPEKSVTAIAGVKGI